VGGSRWLLSWTPHGGGAPFAFRQAVLRSRGPPDGPTLPLGEVGPGQGDSLGCLVGENVLGADVSAGFPWVESGGQDGMLRLGPKSVWSRWTMRAGKR